MSEREELIKDHNMDTGRGSEQMQLVQEETRLSQ